MIRINNLYVKYNVGNREVSAISGVNLDINENDYTALVGPAGSGKSTLLAAISGLIKTQKGEIFLGKNKIGKMSRRQKARLRAEYFSIIFQFSELIARYTVEENLYFAWAAGVHGSNEDFKVRLEYLSAELDILNLLKLYPYQMSGGQLQKVAIARALIKNKSIILADEPSGDLDPENIVRVADLFKKEHESGKTILLVTHDMNLAFGAKTVYELRNGKIDKLLK